MWSTIKRGVFSPINRSLLNHFNNRTYRVSQLRPPPRRIVGGNLIHYLKHHPDIPRIALVAVVGLTMLGAINRINYRKSLNYKYQFKTYIVKELIDRLTLKENLNLNLHLRFLYFRTRTPYKYQYLVNKQLNYLLDTKGIEPITENNIQEKIDRAPKLYDYKSSGFLRNRGGII